MLLKFLLLLVSLTLMAQPIYAQGEATATVRGTVRDSTGAIIPGVTVTLKNVDTGLARTMTTDANGDYVFQRADVGQYQISFELAGFKKVVRTGITLRVNDVAMIDITMEVGEITEEITVEARAPVVESGKMDLGGVVDSRQVIDLPLNGRAFTQLMFLQPGVVASAVSAGGLGSGLYVSGARATGNNFLVDGGSQNNSQIPYGPAGGFSRFVGTGGPDGISADAIQEFRVITNNADAEFGRMPGAQVNIITKSGTNEFHGSLFEFLRNDNLDARNFFDTERPEFRQNNFGFSLGGPIRENRHHFFSNYEGFRQRRATNIRAGLPNADLIRLVPGDLGRLFRAAFLETGLVPPEGNPAQTVSFEPLSAAERQILRARGRTVAGNPGVAIVNLPFPKNFDQDQFLIRMDHQLRGNNRLSVRYNHSQADTPRGAFTGAIPGFRVSFFGRQQSATISDVHIFGPHLLNTFRFNFNRARLTLWGDKTPGPVRALGFGEGDEPTGPPTIGFAATGVAGLGLPLTAGMFAISNEFQWNDTVSFTHGSHIMKTGFDLRRIQNNSTTPLRLRPQITFVGFTGPNGILGPGGMDREPVASVVRQNLFGAFGLGPPSALRGFRQTEYGLFFQDNWKVSQNLTISLGLRYEQFRPFAEVNGFLSNLFAVDGSGRPIPNAPVGVDNILGRQVEVFVIGKGLRFIKTDTNNFAPRIGLSYDPLGSGKMVVRASYGIFYDRVFGALIEEVRFAPPFVADALMVNVPFRLGIAPTTANAQIPGVAAMNPAASTPYTQQWNLTLERELDKDTRLRASYVGLKGTSLIRQILPNLGESGIPTASRPNPQFSTITLTDASAHSIFHGLELEVYRRMSKGLALQVAYTLGKSIDNVSAERISNFDVTGVDSAFPQATITNLGAPDRIGPFGPGQIFADRGLSVFDARQRLVINYIYELPFGSRRKFLSGVRGAWGKLLEGWSVTGIAVLQSGSPLTPITGMDNNRDGTINDRAAALDDPRKALADRNSKVVIDPKLNSGLPTFFLPNRGGGILGDPLDPIDITKRLTRGAFHGPGLSNFDFAVHKRMSLNWIKDRTYMEFRAEFFNLFNHTTLWLKDRGLPYTKESAMCKWWVVRTAVEIIHQCLLLHGHYGYSNEYKIEQRLRDTIGYEIGDGTAEIMKLIIVRELLGREFLPYV